MRNALVATANAMAVCLGAAGSAFGALPGDLKYSVGIHADEACAATASAAVLLPPDSLGFSPFLQASPGVWGGRISLGYGFSGLFGVCGPTPEHLVANMCLAVKASYLYCWSPPRHLRGMHDFLGIEAELGILVVGTCGVYQSVQPHHAKEVLAIWSVGIGL